MKKIIILCLAFTMVLSLTACGSKNDVPPQVGEGSGGAAVYDPLEGATGEGIAATGCVDLTPSKYQVFNEYTYDYLGFSYVLPQEMRDKLTRGEMWVYSDTQMKGEQDFDYSMLFFNLAEKDNLAKEVFASDEEYEQWLTTTKRFGAITVINSEYLKDNTVESITKCKDNKELGKSSDGKYVFYFSTNQVDGATDLFNTIKVTTFDPEKIPEKISGTSFPFNILDGSHK